MPTVMFPNGSRVNVTALAIHAYRDAIRSSIPALGADILIAGPGTHSLAGQFLVDIYPERIFGPVFEDRYLLPQRPVIKYVGEAPAAGLAGLGRPFEFSAPQRNNQFMWFLLEGRDFAAFQRQARFCHYSPDFKANVLHMVFNREVYRITPRRKDGQDAPAALSELMEQVDATFPPCDRPADRHHINTFSVYAKPAPLPKSEPPWADHRRHHVAKIDLVDPIKEHNEWDAAFKRPLISKHVRIRQSPEPEYPIPGLARREQEQGIAITPEP